MKQYYDGWSRRSKLTVLKTCSFILMSANVCRLNLLVYKIIIFKTQFSNPLQITLRVLANWHTGILAYLSISKYNGNEILYIESYHGVAYHKQSLLWFVWAFFHDWGIIVILCTLLLCVYHVKCFSMSYASSVECSHGPIQVFHGSRYVLVSFVHSFFIVDVASLQCYLTSR